MNDNKNILKSIDLTGVKLQVRVSQKTGNKYICYVLPITNNSERLVMPESNLERDILVQVYKLDEFVK